MSTHSTELTLPIEVEYVAHAASRGHRDKYGAPEEPDEPAYVEIVNVTHDGQAIHITDAEADDLVEEIEQRLADDAADEGPEPDDIL